ncbi:MAG: rhomboid family intramembrane serine protease [Myxococcota bacterium]
MLPLWDLLPSRRRPYATYTLIALNVLFYLVERASIGAVGAAAFLDWALVPARFVSDPATEAVTLLSSMFMHDPNSWWHLAGNMLFLWIFGDNVEDALGPERYVGFYLASGVAATLLHIGIDPASTVPLVGASGAIAGVLAAYGSLYPRSPVVVLNPIPLLWLFFGLFFQLPAWLVILEFFVMNLLNGFGSLGATGGGVAFFAHVGGFLAGLALVRTILRPRRRVDGARRWGGFKAGRQHAWRPPERRVDPRVRHDPWLGPRR